MADISNLRDQMAELEDEAVMATVQAVVDEGGEQAQEALTALQEGIKEVGDRYESGEYFLPDLIFAGEFMSEAVEVLKPVLGAASDGAKGRMILCTVKNDLHDIGKNIVKTILEAAGMEVVDLGIDVDPQLIIDTIKEQDIKIVALSGVLTLALDSMKETVEALEAAGIRDQVKVIVGGNPVTDVACEVIGADAWSSSPQKTTDICVAWAAEL